MLNVTVDRYFLFSAITCQVIDQLPLSKWISFDKKKDEDAYDLIKFLKVAIMLPGDLMCGIFMWNYGMLPVFLQSQK